MNCALPGCRSNYSLLWGTAFPEELIAAGKAAGYEHLGLADHDNLYGAIDFYQGCRENGLNPMVGVRLTTEAGALHLVARNYGGYQNLCRLVTYRQLNGPVSIAELSSFREGIACLAPPGAPLADLKPIFDGNLFLSLEGDESWPALSEARRLDIKPAANPGVSFLASADYRLHLLLRAIDSGSLISNLNGTVRDRAEAFFLDSAAIRRRFRHTPEAIANTFELAESCRLEFPERKNILPRYRQGNGAGVERLREKALAGLQTRRKTTAVYLSRLDFELEIIRRTGYADYFLIVSGIVDFCHQAGIPVVGRGSAAGSLVAYALAITSVDPIREGLYFERFLNEARSDPPDADLDIDWRRRDDVLTYIYDEYGHEHTAMMASYTRFQSRLAVREVAKANGLASEEIDGLIKDIPRFGPNRRTEKAVVSRPEYGDVFADAASLHNLPRHLGIHPGGVVITPRPLTDYVALERSTKGLVVTQCDMYQAEKLGLVKIDILGQRGQAVIVDCRNDARHTAGDDFIMPENDPATWKLLQSGRTIGVFQIESPGLRALLRDLKPKELNDLTLALSLIRPGASDSGMKNDFLDCHHGQKEASYPDPCLEPILRDTHGVFIYQEQVLLCARAVAGFNLPAADILRRSITKDRHGNGYEALRQRFLKGAIERGISAEKANHIFDLLSLFAGFGFCKAHAATYAALAYQSAYFKTHYPARFMTAVLNNGGGYYPAAVYIAEARRRGVAIRPPDINRSNAEETLTGTTMHIGLGRIKGLEQETIEHILKERPFAALDDFIRQVRLSVAEAEALIRVGAFDSIDDCRPRLLWRLRLARGNSSTASGNGDFFGGRPIVPEARSLPPLPDFSPLEKFLCEQEFLGFSASTHPLEIFPGYDRRPFSQAASGKRHGQSISMTAWLADIKRIKTREKKEPMVFLTFDDLEDTFEAILFPAVYRSYEKIIRRFRFLQIEGTLNIEGGSRAIVASRLSPAPTGLDRKPFL